jgi:hypothetical protein
MEALRTLHKGSLVPKALCCENDIGNDGASGNYTWTGNSALLKSTRRIVTGFGPELMVLLREKSKGRIKSN